MPVAKRASSPALYEVIGSRLRQAQQERQELIEPPPDEPAPQPFFERFSWLAPGTVFRVPVGHVLIASAAVLLILVACYLVGYKRGVAISEEASDALLKRQAEAERMQSAGFDPLARRSTTPTSADSRTGQATPAGQPQAGDSQTAAGPVESDPRKPGLNYFVLAETTRDGALRLVEFCRGRGLEAYVVKSNNARLRQVIVLPGYQSSDRGTAAIKALEARIKDVGRRWASEPGSGKDNLGGYYPVKFNG